MLTVIAMAHQVVNDTLPPHQRTHDHDKALSNALQLGTNYLSRTIWGTTQIWGNSVFMYKKHETTYQNHGQIVYDEP